MASSPASSDLSDPPSAESDNEDRLSTAVPSSRPSADIPSHDPDHLAPPAKRRRTGGSSHAAASFDRLPSSQPPDDDDAYSQISSDGFSSAPGSPAHGEYALREEAQTQCLWRDCHFGEAQNNDELVRHVQTAHCATAGPKKTKYTCEWGECQRKTSNHPSGYALKAHMRSHTKEKPYYCALPECDKAFTRSDALAKHMRTVHEPEPPHKTDPTPPGKKPVKLKLTNGASGARSSSKTPQPADVPRAPAFDEDGAPVTPSPANDNIAYIPAHHPITGQAGFMITYPPDINFTAWESSIPADQLMRLLRRQLHWAEREGEALQKECDELERIREKEWCKKEVLVEGWMEVELGRAERDGMLESVSGKVRECMERDVLPAKRLGWTGVAEGARTWWRQPEYQEGSPMDADDAEEDGGGEAAGEGGGFEGDADPYDNYLAGRMAELEERERLRSLRNTPDKRRADQKAAEADAVGALMGMSGGMEG